MAVQHHNKPTRAVGKDGKELLTDSVCVCVCVCVFVCVCVCVCVCVLSLIHI